MADVEILGPRARRRIWGAQEKAALLAEVDAEGGKVRLVARRHAISESLLYNWRSARKAAAVAAGAPEDVTFVPVGVIEDKVPHGPALLAPPEPALALEGQAREGQASAGQKCVLPKILMLGQQRSPPAAAARRTRKGSIFYHTLLRLFVYHVLRSCNYPSSTPKTTLLTRYTSQQGTKLDAQSLQDCNGQNLA